MCVCVFVESEDEIKSKFVGEITRVLWKERIKQGLGLCVSALKVVNPLEWI